MTEMTCQPESIHVALLPSSGMGHLTPFLRLAASLVAAGVRVTFITTYPTVSDSESRALSTFFSAFNGVITPKELHLPPVTEPMSATIADPFYHHMELIRRSSHLLPPLLSSNSPPLSAIIMDMSLIKAVLPLTRSLNLPSYAFFTSSAKMLTLFVSCHTIFTSKFMEEKPDLMTIPGQEPMPTSFIPSSFFNDKTHFLRNYLVENGKKMSETDGILINTMSDLESDALTALNGGRVVNTLPDVVPIGPLPPLDCAEGSQNPWLESQPSGSVLFVSFGSRTAVSREQMRELGKGLVKSGFGFVWAVKDKMVDRDDEVALDDVFGQVLLERLQGQGLVVKDWVKQSEILGHRAVGGFMSHGGWNSVMEAVWHGVPVLVWPQHGDQRVNASLVERSGVGIWDRSWGWGRDALVTADQIGDRITEVMRNEAVRSKVVEMKGSARAAAGVEGSSVRGIAELIGRWKRH